ncbi:MAG: ATP-binding protein [Deltaproteobacteria bacterium]|jgi:predicted AAA+ superfamily ATPase|nr:ATP-binding protein [Deltaproteobacteria bacterium]
MYKRNITHKIELALSDTPIVFIRGPRRCGKTTLAKTFCQDGTRSYYSLDTFLARSEAMDDPFAIINSFKTPMVIDEIQKAPDLIQAIKVDVDNDERPGQWLLTGSINPMLLPRVADLTLGRAETLDLRPLSQSELLGQKADFPTRLFGDTFTATAEPWSRERLFEALCAGGFPAAIVRSPSRRGAWIDSYLTQTVERDLRDVFNVQDLRGLGALLKLLGARTSTILNVAEICRGAALNANTLSRYMALLEMAFLVWTLPPWSDNLGKGLARAPKIHLTDSAFACHLNRTNVKNLLKDLTLAGRLLESFVASEIQRQASWSETKVWLSHFRSHKGDEVDLVLTNEENQVAGVEVKLSFNIGQRDFKGLSHLRDALGDRFARGVIFYGGHDLLCVGDRLYATPIGELFSPA